MLTRRTTLGLIAAGPVLGLAPAALRAAEPPIYTEGGIAIDGSDTVAYFTEGRLVAGVAGITAEWMGVTWHFASVANQGVFMTDPDRYAPVFGGYCAFAAARGYIAPTVPEAWTIYEGRLFLNFSLRIRRRWLDEVPEAITAGEANWPGILG
ncbi:MAG: YHS domain protein [Rhodobacteraceae bacterium]|nr:YHS domain protein [Paracoccaceae bacterium]